MPRLNNGQEVLAKLEKMFKYTIPLTGVVETTLSAAAAKTDDALALTSEAGLVDGDDVLVFGDAMEIATIEDLDAVPDSLLTLPIAFDAASGSRVVKATKSDLGYLEEGGVALNSAFSLNAVQAANADSAIAYIKGEGAELDISFGLRETNLENILAAFAIDESTLSGAGTASDPYLAVVGRDTIGSQANYAMRGTFRQVNNKPVWVDFLNCFAQVQVSAQLGAKGTPTVWTVSARPTDIVIRQF